MRVKDRWANSNTMNNNREGQVVSIVSVHDTSLSPDRRASFVCRRPDGTFFMMPIENAQQIGIPLIDDEERNR